MPHDIDEIAATSLRNPLPLLCPPPQELGGAPPPEMMGDFSGMERQQAADHGRPRRPGDELPDDCKLYVGGLPNVYDESMLRSLFSAHGSVLHAGEHAYGC